MEQLLLAVIPFAERSAGSVEPGIEMETSWRQIMEGASSHAVAPLVPADTGANILVMTPSLALSARLNALSNAHTPSALKGVASRVLLVLKIVLGVVRIADDVIYLALFLAISCLVQNDARNFSLAATSVPLYVEKYVHPSNSAIFVAQTMFEGRWSTGPYLRRMGASTLTRLPACSRNVDTL